VSKNAGSKIVVIRVRIVEWKGDRRSGSTDANS
jgi:hypothetical protein